MKIDWTSHAECLAYVISLGPGHTLFKDPEQSKYNVILTQRKKDFKIPEEWVIINT